jgi:hypothetical protein
MEKQACWERIGRARGMRSACLFFFIGIFIFCGLPAHASEHGAMDVNDNRLQSLKIDGYFDPARNFLDATVRLSFAQPAGELCLWLAPELELSSVRSGSHPVLKFKRDSGQFVVQNQVEEDLELRYSGRLVLNQDPFVSSCRQNAAQPQPDIDDYRFLSYIKDFYPHPQFDFTSMNITFSVPSGWNCLGSGHLLSVQPGPDVSTFIFDNSEAKGMALVCGHFTQLDLVDGVIPLRLYGGPGFKYKRYFSGPEIIRVLSFFHECFGPLNIRELHVLFKRGSNYGGLSYNGLLVLSVDESLNRMMAKERKEIESGSPIAMIDSKTDLLTHEMAHQWWGGLMSWKTTADNWITEGLATYSTLLCVRKWEGEKAYRKVLKQLRARVKKYAGLGTPAEGFQLKLLNRDIKVYQTLVYIKPVLMFAELADKMGEAELCRRLRSVLQERRCTNVNTQEFLSLLSAGDEAVRARLAEWICSKGLPADS